MDIIPPKHSGQSPPPYQRVPSPGNISPAARPYESPTPAAGKPPQATGPSSWREALSLIILLASALIIAFLLNAFVIQSYQVDGESMQQTLQNNDRLIVNKIPRTISRLTGHQYVPHRGDIIIFNESGLPGFVGSKQLIKRVIGLPGDHIVVSNGTITIYNSAHPGGFNPDTAAGYRLTAPSTIGSVDKTLQKNELFVCGDNRDNSEDSRYFGPIKTDQIVAKLILRILPLNTVKTF